jgi:hypothetical protein
MDFTSLTTEQILDFGKPCEELKEVRDLNPSTRVCYSLPFV